MGILFRLAVTCSFIVPQRHAALKVLLVNVMCHLAWTPWAALLFYKKMAADSEGTILWPHPSLEAWWWNCIPLVQKQRDFIYFGNLLTRRLRTIFIVTLSSLFCVQMMFLCWDNWWFRTIFRWRRGAQHDLIFRIRHLWNMFTIKRSLSKNNRTGVFSENLRKHFS